MIIPVCDTNGERYDITVPAGYCSICNHYFILWSVFDSIRTYGKPLCQVYETIPEVNYSSTKKKIEGLSLESPLHLYGYDVNKESDLSELQRWAILEEIIDCKILTKENVISYLAWFCDIRKTIPKMADAVRKWRVDRKHIVEYVSNADRKVAARSITYSSRM